MNEKVCGTCKHGKQDGYDWICINYDSEYYGDWIDYKHTCDDWEGKEMNNK